MFKKLLLALLVSTASYADGLQSQRYFDNTGGLIDHISPLLVPDKNATEILNITLDDRGQLSKRGGYELNNTTGTLGPGAVTGGGYHTATTGSSFFAVVVGTNVYRTSNSFGGSYTNITGTNTITASSSNLAQTTSINDVLVVCNESDRPFKVPASGNAVPLNVATAPSAARTCATYGNYLVLANTTESSVNYPSRVRWSDLNTVDSFPANNFIDVEPNDGDKIVAIINFEDSIFIFKKRSIYKMVITGDEGANAFIIRPIIRSLGAWAKNSVKPIPGVGIMFLAQNTVYLFDGESVSPAGDPIQRTIDEVQRSQWANAVAAVYPKRYQYWIAVSTASTTNSKVLVYDYVQKAWTVYTNMTVNMLSQAEDLTGANILLSGDSSGNVYKQDTGTADEPLGVQSAIPATYSTGDITFGGPEITKGYKYLYVFTELDQTTILTVNATFDFQSVAESSSTVTLGQVGATYDVAIYDVDQFPSSLYKVTRLEINRSARAIKLQFINNDTEGIFGLIGWTIVYSVEDYRQ